MTLSSKIHSAALAFALAAFLPTAVSAAASDRSRPERALSTQDTTGKAVQHTYTDEFLDTVKINKKFIINDYTTIGVQYGVGMNAMSFNPPKKQGSLITPVNFGVTVTNYGKMFGFLPYFGLQAGLFYGQDGYLFKPNKEGEYNYDVDGATKCIYDLAEGHFLSLFHADVWRVRLMASLGIYGGYRMKIQRWGDNLDPQYATSFRDYERRWDYGAKFGAGFGFLIDPVEIFFKADYKWGWSSLYKPDYASEYYYRFAYPSDFVFSFGVHFQITKRTGKTSAQLRREAREIVNNPEAKQ